MYIKEIIKRLYIRSCGYSYTNLGRLFLRLFVGIMMIQFCVRQLAHFDQASTAFDHLWNIEPLWGLGVFIGIGMTCSIFLMFGFLTRLMTLPLFIIMLFAECELFNGGIDMAPYLLSWQSGSYIPVMFLGIYFFLLLVGPGKISVDYFLSLHLIHSADESEDEELEEV